MFLKINDMMKEYNPADKTRKRQSIILNKDFWKLSFKVFCMFFVGYFKHFIDLFKIQKTEKIAGQLALVTGGANGLGRALCFRLAQEGCDIAVVDIDFKNATKTAKEIQEEFKIACNAYECDVSNRSAIMKLKNAIEKEMRKVDILVNNAGIIYSDDFAKSELDDIERVINVNYLSQILMTRIFLTDMLEKKYGRILSVCSVSAFIPMPLAAIYSSTKAGIYRFMVSLYYELLALNGDKSIKLTTIHPSLIDTRREIFDCLKKTGNGFLPIFTPEEVADKAVTGMMKNKRNIYIIPFKFTMPIIRNFPENIILCSVKATFDKLKMNHAKSE